VSRVAATIALASVLLVAGATPAAAHSGRVAASDYRSTITHGVEIPGGHLRLIEAGGRVELSSPRVTVLVRGYEGEPYLRVGPRGVEENRQSPATYLNASRTGRSAPPSGIDPSGPPRWVRISTGSTVRWHDHRTHVMGGAPLPNRVNAWELHLVVDGRARTVRGELVHVPGPASWPWLVLALVVATAVVAAGKRGLVPALGALVVADVVRVSGLTLAVADRRVAQAVDVGIVDLVGWGLAILALVRIRRRRTDGVLAAGVTGLLLAIVGGAFDWSDLARSQLAVSTPGSLHRLCITSVAGLGMGVAIAALREVGRVPVRATTTPPR
jgi:hypothetical protein